MLIDTSNIPLLRFLRPTVGEIVHHKLSTVVLSSARANWQKVAVEEHRFLSYELHDAIYAHHVLALNIGPPITCEVKNNGRFQHMRRPTGTILLSPSQETICRYCKAPQKDELADVLLLTLDPLFVSQTAEDLGVYADRIELLEQERVNDPVLMHIGFALRAGVEAPESHDSMYGDAMATALSVHLLREYSSTSLVLPDPHRGLPREKLKRAIAYIHDQLQTSLTVSAIAREVCMSPHHFTLLFKQSTGQSPYQYVIDTRTRKARDLLASRKHSISEIAHQVGFADQSHLTRHIKRLFGITPRVLASTQHSQHDSNHRDEASTLLTA